MRKKIFDFISRYIIVPIFFVIMSIWAVITSPFFWMWMFIKKNKTVKKLLLMLCVIVLVYYNFDASVFSTDHCIDGPAKIRGRCTARQHIERDFNDIGKVINMASHSDKKYRCEVFKMRIRYIRRAYKEYYDANRGFFDNEIWWAGYIGATKDFLNAEEFRVKRYCGGVER